MTREQTAVQRRSPEAAFGLLADDLRVAVVRELGAAGEPMTFSELRAAVGDPDSGQFNYHLRKLVGAFVAHEDGAYSLTLAGGQVYGAILSGTYTADAVVEPFEFPGPCPLCGNATLEASYGDEKARLSCPGCSEWRNEFSFPPATLDQFDRETLPAAFDAWMRGTVAKVLQGFCTNCGGRSVGRLEAGDGEGPMAVRATYECGRCGDELHASPALPVLFHADAVAFFAAHGVDVFADDSWRYFDAANELTVEVAAEDPLSARVVVALDDETLAATIGEDATVVDATVEPRTAD